jgi:hypothetical protein
VSKHNALLFNKSVLLVLMIVSQKDNATTGCDEAGGTEKDCALFKGKGFKHLQKS